ncbi:MAG: TlpA family protein disulfide reductase, partial [Proteobacteria bacterium]|nr:TlpA family protein disulfide reductase [Pseudomonadota bacterium]
VKFRLKFDNRLDKALETLERAEIRLGQAEEQKWLVENNKGSVEKAYKNISRLRAEIFFRQERWKESYDRLIANAPDYLESLSERFCEDTIDYFYMLARSAEGIEDWETARRSYTDAHFAPTPHVDARTGLERVYHQIGRGEITDTFDAFLKDTEVEYQIREDADREKIRQRLITNRLNKKAPDFRLQTLQGEAYTLSAMSGKIVLLEIGSSRTRVHNRKIPEVKRVYEQFSKVDDVVVWGINDGITTHQVRKFIDGHQVPWPILLDPHGEVRKAYQIIGIPCFILIDKMGDWQYSGGLDLINGQPLIWMIEALLSD